jgi:hypothetical protein
LTASIGNVLKTPLADIWLSLEATAIRSGIIDNSYRKCNLKNCLLYQNYSATHHIVNLMSDNNATLATPQYIRFHVDNSCNLACVGCRSQITLVNSKDQQYNVMHNVIKNTLDALFPEPHLQKKILLLDNVGEFIASPVWNYIFKTSDIFTKPHLWPNTKFQLFTSGILMTAEWQQANAHILAQTSLISVSVVAGSQLVYTSIRGNYWDTLWANLRHLSDNNPHIKVVWSMLVSETTFSTIPSLITIANTFSNLPFIQLGKLKEWGTFTGSALAKLDITNPTHALHASYVDVMLSESVKSYPNFYIGHDIIIDLE